MVISKIKTFFNRKTIFLLCLALIMLFLSMRLPLDPDLGWHLRSGEYIWQNKALADHDPFSHTFPEYPWIAHEWLSDLLLYGLNSLGAIAGPVVMSVFFGIIGSLAFYLVGKIVAARKEYQMLAALLALLVSLPIVGIRPQVFSMLGLGLTFYILYRFRSEQGTKAIYFLPLVFLLWVNLHGGFAFGLFTIALFFAIELGRVIFKHLYERYKKRELKLRILRKTSFYKLIIIGLISGAVTLINPYGLRIYYEVYNTFINTTGTAIVKQNIGEWNPVQFGHLMSYQLIAYLILFAILLLFSFRKIDITHLIITAVFFVIGLSSWRHMPLLMLAITPFWVLIAQTLTGDTLARIVRKKYVLVLFIIALGLIIRQQAIAMIQIGLDPEKAAEKGKYPYKAVQYLKANPLKGEMLNEYNHGGYLVWNYPEKKVFIDGRMAIWELNGKNIYEDWQKIGSTIEGNLDILDRYNVDWVMIRWPLKLAEVLRRNENWKEIYRDELVSIIVRVGSQDEN